MERELEFFPILTLLATDGSNLGHFGAWGTVDSLITTALLWYKNLDTFLQGTITLVKKLRTKFNRLEV